MDERELLALLRRDAERGMELLIERYVGLVCTVIKSRLGTLGSKEDVEDCASEVFADFYLHRKRFDPKRGTVKAYLCASARHKAVDLFRKRAKESERSASEEKVTAEAVSEDISCEETVILAEERRSLACAIAMLDAVDREIVVRKYLIGERTKEIAARLNMTDGAVDVRAHRAIEKLRKRIGGETDEEL